MWNFIQNKRSHKHHISKTGGKKRSHLRTVKPIVLNPLIRGEKLQ